jgi:hypothetical protein
MNDSIMLSDEILNIIAPGHGDNTEIKFDDYGTLHVIERNEDGGIIKDWPVVDTSVLGEKEIPTVKDELQECEMKTRQANVRFRFLMLTLGLILAVGITITCGVFPQEYISVLYVLLIVFTLSVFYIYLRWLKK